MHIIQVPNNTTLSIEELYDKYVSKILIEPSVVEKFRKELIKYCQSNYPVYLIRQLKGKKRGLIYQNGARHQIMPTDNSPAWWLHYKLFNKETSEMTYFSEFLSRVPSHLFQIKVKGHVNHAEWHVAHIFNAKNYKTDDTNWGTTELTNRTLRNIHPCNYFYLPKTNWHKNGSDNGVIGYFYEKFKMKYGSIFSEFESIVNTEGKRFEASDNNILDFFPN